MVAPKYRLGDRVQVLSDHVQGDLRHRVGVVSDPGEHLRHTKPRWPATYWKADPPGSLRIVYWIDFGSPGSTRGEVCAAEVDEAHLSPA